MTFRPVADVPVGERLRRRFGGVSAPVIAADLGPVFYALEVEARLPGSAPVPEARGVGAAPVGALTRRLASREHVTTLRVSDRGYRTAPTDNLGALAYPPLLDSAFGLDRTLGLPPDAANLTYGWGRAVIHNADRRWDAIAARYNADGRRARVLAGQKRWDDDRLIWTDPPYATLRPVFGGIAEPWFLTDTALTIPLRDVSYWLENTLHLDTYAGTGGYEGTPSMAGRPKPITLGGTSGQPVRHVSPVLVDPVNLVYQYHAGPGTTVRVYEGGNASQIVNAGDVPDLLTGSAPLGSFRTCNARGMFQLGSRPSLLITADVTGGSTATAAGIARAILARVQVPAEFIDEDSFNSVAGTHSAPCGWYWPENTDAASAANFMLGSIGARLVTTRDGRLRLVMLRATDEFSRPDAAYTASHIVNVVPIELGAPLAPAPVGWQVGYERFHTVQTTNVSGGVSATDAQQLGQEWRQASATNPEVISITRRPSRPGLVRTALLTPVGAQSMADALRDLWCTSRPRRLYRLTMPEVIAQRHELGQRITVKFPIDDLDGGRVALIVGDALQAGSQTGSITVLV